MSWLRSHVRRVTFSSGTLVVVALLVACGGDSGGAAGSDEAYVTDMCKAASELETESAAVIAKISAGDFDNEQDMLKAFAGLFEDAEKAFKKANPRPT